MAPVRRPRPPAELPDDPALRGLVLRAAGRRAQARRAVAAAEGAVAEPGAGTVLDLKWETPDLLRFTLARPAGFDFRPGDSVRLEVDGVRRRYTIVSAPHQPFLEFFVEMVPGGAMSARFKALRRGQRLTIASPPKAGLRLEQGRRPLMLATVTGVNPFVSMLRDAVHRGRTDLRAVLVQGASFRDEFGYFREIAALARAHPRLVAYLPTVSRPDDPRNRGWTGAPGRVAAHLDGLARYPGLGPAEVTVLACGNPGMIDGARAQLGPLGYTVRSESYA